MKKFHKIKSFHHVVKGVYTANNDDECPEQHKVMSPVTYRGTVKLHGTNAGVECCGDIAVPQSRSRVITSEDDNLRFAAFVEQDEQQSALLEIAGRVRADNGIQESQPVTIFGEWCGPGIQRGCAINKLPARQFVIFAAWDGESYLPPGAMAYQDMPDAGIYFIDNGPSWSVTVDFGDHDSLAVIAADLSDIVLEVEKQCPWAALFGAEGIGEGVVWRPTGEHADHDIWFKTKGGKHRGASTKPKVRPDPEVVASVAAFVDMVATEERLRRGVDAMREDGHPISMQSTGHYLRWFALDVQQECATELVASGLVWKQVAKRINSRAVAFWKLVNEELPLAP